MRITKPGKERVAGLLGQTRQRAWLPIGVPTWHCACSFFLTSMGEFRQTDLTVDQFLRREP